MKKVKKIEIEFEQFQSLILKNKPIIIDFLFLNINKNRDLKYLYDFLKINNDVNIFFKRYSSIKNIKSIYYNICDIIFKDDFYKNDFLDLREKDPEIRKIIDYASHYSPFYASKKIEEDKKENNLRVEELKQYIEIFSEDKEYFCSFMANEVTSIISKENFIDFKGKYKDLNLLEKIEESEVFSIFYLKLQTYSENSIRYNENRILLLDANIIDKVFKNINEKIKKGIIDPQNASKNLYDFTSSYFKNLEQKYHNRDPEKYYFNITYTKSQEAAEIFKKNPNMYEFYLKYDPFISITRLTGNKNEILEKRIIEKEYSQKAIEYVKNIIDNFKEKSSFSEEQIFEKIKKDYKDIINLIIKDGCFIQYLLLYDTNLNFIQYINSKNIIILINEEDFLDLRPKLLEKYFNELKKQNINLKKIINKYYNLLEYINDFTYYGNYFLDLYKDEIEENLNEIKKLDNIYYQYVLLNYKKLNVYDHLEKLRSNQKYYNLFINLDDNLINFMINHQDEIPFELDKSFQNKLSTPKSILTYLYCSRKKLNLELESIIKKHETKTPNTIYNKFLKDPNKMINKYKKLENFVEYLGVLDEEFTWNQ